jgi:hypothetical protein
VSLKFINANAKKNNNSFNSGLRYAKKVGKLARTRMYTKSQNNNKYKK